MRTAVSSACAPMYPIVLCHGLFGFDRRGPQRFPSLQVRYWDAIVRDLESIQCTVYEAKVPSTGTIVERARALRAFLNSLHLPAVNLVAHSMGGLDCRLLIANDAPTCKVLSLTTIATPHRGSPFMDWCADVFKVGCNEASLRGQLGRLFDLPAYSNLTTNFCSNFNERVLNDPNVVYFSYGAQSEFPAWSPLRFPYEIIKSKEGENDGVVSVKSSKWGTYLGTVPADHWALTSRRLQRNFNSRRLYFDVASNLSSFGF